jgi:hypothetical protein
MNLTLFHNKIPLIDPQTISITPFLKYDFKVMACAQFQINSLIREFLTAGSGYVSYLVTSIYISLQLNM